VFNELTANVSDSVRGQFDEQPTTISARYVFAEDKLALAMIDLTDASGAVAFVPTLLKAKHVDVEANRAGQIRNEEYRTRIPPMNSLASHGLL
jgi:hypothetical protein